MWIIKILSEYQEQVRTAESVILYCLMCSSLQVYADNADYNQSVQHTLQLPNSKSCTPVSTSELLQTPQTCVPVTGGDNFYSFLSRIKSNGSSNCHYAGVILIVNVVLYILIHLSRCFLFL